MKKLSLESFRERFPEARIRRYGKNQIICYEGDTPPHIFFTIKGHIKYYGINENGQEKILHIMGPQNIFPMLYAYEVSKEIDNFYVAIDDVELLVIPLMSFRSAIKSDAVFGNELTRWFLTEIEQLVRRINSFEKTDSRQKILHALKYLTLNHGEGDDEWDTLNFTVTQQFLADFTGLTRETVGSVLHDLEKESITRSAKGRLVAVKRAAVENIVAV